MSITDEIKQSFIKGNALTRLIYINLGVFLLLNILFIIFLLGAGNADNKQNIDYFFNQTILNWFTVSSSLQVYVLKPWTAISYMFTHMNFIHILFNMFNLYWFGKLFIDYLGSRKLTATYLLGGLGGALIYILFYNVFPVFSNEIGRPMLGASASVFAVVFAISVYSPNTNMNLPFIGPVKILYLAIILFIASSLVDFSDNTGGKIAHFGGAIYGYIFGRLMKKGVNISNGFENYLFAFFAMFKPKPKMKVTYGNPPRDDKDYNAEKAREQLEIDDILEKISKSGYDSLTKKEKELLFRASNKK